MPGIGYLAFRSLFRLAEQIAPRTTGRMAFELFRRTPSPRRMNAREARAVSAAAPFMAGARHHAITTRHGRFVAHDFRPALVGRVPTVLVVHGWRSRTEHMRGVIEALLAQGLRVVAVDLPGHGASPGHRLDMAIAVASLRAAADWFGPFEAIVGHSFGGAVAVNAAIGSVRGVAPVETGRLILIAAPSSMPAIFQDFGRFLGLGARAQTALAAEVERVAGAPLESFVGAEQLRSLRLPTLAIHAPDDREVPFAEACRMEAAGDHVRLLRAPGRGHRRILADPSVVEAAARFAAGFDPVSPVT